MPPARSCRPDRNSCRFLPDPDWVCRPGLL